jgi:hypothetical protein
MPTASLPAETQASSEPRAAVGDDCVPLVVDLDGTLVRTDTLWESLLLLVKSRP